jgi:hypothetical protein
MRYFIKPKSEPALTWLLNIDAAPRVLPIFPEDARLGLVVAQLLSGGVLAEVLPQPTRIADSVGPGVPLGRLYFQVPRTRLFEVCPELTNQAFEPKSGGERQ